MILAAGKGERMLPLTRELPKPLLPIGETTLIQKHLAALSEAGIERVVINVHHFADKIMNLLGNRQFGMEIVYSRETELLETAGGIQAALSLLGDEPFLIVNGDIYTDYPFAKLTTPGPSLLPHLVMVANPAHHQTGDFAVRTDGVLLANAPDQLTYAGIGIYDSTFFSEMEPGKEKLRPLFDAAVEKEQLFGERYDGLWSDIGTPERYEELRARLQ